MDYAELKTSIEGAPLASRATLERLLLYVSSESNVLPEYEPYLDGATSYQDFFNALYADETQKNTSVWAAWAVLKRKSWIYRFEPDLIIENLRLKGDGLPIQFGTGLMLAPTGSRDNIANFYVFQRGAFNVEAAEFVTSIGGTFTCAGYDFAGIYGVYKYRGSVILEQWEADCAPVPSDAQ
ncbi:MULTISPECIES: hypothetical protein [Gordonibacter]|uniref:Uncharacterized protein n=1 Tax=Gordonibacter faecis TaxID=3047475 RepID=A0ABT7DNI5_9ACTN|nr:MULTISPECIES: hypothetical protein [unclassified Gordonibacter]MDJ1651096.1 hypothetical protein [Gordonibacter sp. KGMB12511]HIW75400.1 hypothetical protein [Candidatus Gordonibacter avicola]